MTGQKRIVLSDNDLLRKTHPVLLDIFSRGVLETQSQRLVQAAFIAMVISPVVWIVALFKKGIHLTILLAVYWFLREEIASLGALGNMLVAVAFLAIIYKEIYRESVTLLLYIVVIITGGGFLRWLCKGYLAGNGFRQLWLTSQPMEVIIGTMVAAISRKYRDQYNKLMDLYLDSNQSNNEDELNRLLDDYERGNS